MDEKTNVSKFGQIKAMENSHTANGIQHIVFRDDNIGFFIFKKTERIVSALYIISSFLSDTAPARISIRDIANNLLKDTLELSNRHLNENKKLIIVIKGFANISILINAISDVGEMSKMNAEILLEEIEKISEILIKTWSNKNMGSKLFDPSFFEINTDECTGYNQRDIKDNITDNVLYKNTSMKSSGQTGSIKDKSNRQETIISMLKKDKILTIKDFSKNIKGCSEKTIQRELINLMSKGVLKKEGERRWSKYSLA